MKWVQYGRRGFTLIELLTVIAIISILAGLILAGLPRVLERAKIANMQNNFKQIHTALTVYLTDHGTYPPAYGYLDKSAIGLDPSELNMIHFIYRPYMAYIGEFGNRDLYDTFALKVDSDNDGQISRLEFSPVGTRIGPNKFGFESCGIYQIAALACPAVEQGEITKQLREDTRPIVYIPVYTRYAERAAQFWYNQNPNDPRPTNNPGAFAGMSFPPPKYDAFVLISAGPAGSTFGLLNWQPPQGIHPAFTYHVIGMMAYFMATRDADGNGELDFDFLARSRRGEGKGLDTHRLPDPVNPNGFGPLIYVGR